MSNKTEINFPLWDSLKRGFLSLWLNRQALLPLTALPIGVTFVTLSLIRTYAPEDTSHFMQALFQLPADFAIGIFCALIITIIMSAPKKKQEETVAFSLNLKDKRDVMIAGAIAHTVFGYLYLGGFAVIDMVAEPLRVAAQAQEAVRWDLTFLVIGLLIVGLYAIRFSLLPILVIGEMSIKDFYKRFKVFGLSFPIFFTKIAIMLVVGVVFLLPLGTMAPAEGESLSAAQSLVADFAASIAAVLSHAWSYAALAIGVRYMIEGENA